MIITVNFNRTPGYKGFDLDIDEVRLKKFMRKGSGVNVLFIDDSYKEMGSEVAAWIKHNIEHENPVRIVHAENIISDIRREKRSMIEEDINVSIDECVHAFYDYLQNKYIKCGFKVIVISWYMRSWECVTTYKYNSYLLSYLPMHDDYAILVINDVPVKPGLTRFLKRIWNWLTRCNYCRDVRRRMEECLNDDICHMHEEYEKELAKKRR